MYILDPVLRCAVLFLVRGILFALIWLVTFGKHKFWLFPNLTEDCGVVESFIPLYTHEVVQAKDDSDPPAAEKETTDDQDGSKDGGDEKVVDDVSHAKENGDGDLVAEENKTVNGDSWTSVD